MRLSNIFSVLVSGIISSSAFLEPAANQDVASAVYAQNVTHCANGACYAINVPESTASSGSGDIFFQISGPTSFSWIGLGQSAGEGMTGANIFMIYADATGTNVTLSPRMGVGEVQPIYGAGRASRRIRNRKRHDGCQYQM
jgi:hypothetical protein